MGNKSPDVHLLHGKHHGLIMINAYSNECKMKRGNASSAGEPEWDITSNQTKKNLCSKATKLTWKQWNSSDAIKIHSGYILPNAVSEVIVPGIKNVIFSNGFSDSRLSHLRPVSSAMIMACYSDVKPVIDLVTTCKNLTTNVENFLSLNEDKVCIWGENLNLAGLFQHFYINSAPIRGMAKYLQTHFFPKALLVGNQGVGPFYALGNVTLDEYSSERCEMLLFVHPVCDVKNSLLDPPPLQTLWDCYPQGSFDYIRKRMPFHTLDVAARNLLIYAARDHLGRRMPSPTSSTEIDRKLCLLAETFNLTYVKLDNYNSSERIRHSFERARIVVGPHGGMLTNIVFSHPSTLVVEIQPQNPDRFCFYCMAFAMHFKTYTFFLEDSWSGIETGNFSVNVDSLMALIRNVTKANIRHS